MADSEKTEHVNTSKMELFCARVLDEAELHTIARHLSNCPDCGQQFVATLGRQKVGTMVSFTLAPEFWLRHEHLAFEHLVKSTENKLDAADRELIDVHLETCAPCREDVQSFLAFRKQIEPEMAISYIPVVLEPTHEKITRWNPLRGLAWKPIYAAAILLIAIALIIGALYLKRRADNFQAVQTPNPSVNPADPSQTPTPDNRASHDPPAPANESPTEKPNSAVAVVTLNDGGGVVTVDADGSVSGLDDVPVSTRDEIAQALLTERIARPSILKELGEDSTLRGSDNRQSFKLISPARAVLNSDRPTFKWDKLLGASTYRVYVNDREGNLVATSEVLSSERTEWHITKPLKRGQIYAWTVVALVDGNEIVAPGPSASEIRFSIMSSNSLQQLNKLRATRSHLALGVFFAQHGMITEARQEFEIVIRNNPGAASAKRLLRQIQAWESR
jgi:predicted anti-sigma-YlaC factor YlaD